MKDNILEVKKEIRCIAKAKNLTRMEKYELAKKRSEQLSECERKILIEEGQRDYETYDRIQDIRELFTFFFAGMSMIISVFAIFAKGNDISEQYGSMSLAILLNTLFVIGFFTVIQIYRSDGLNVTQYIIDILKNE